MSNFCHPENPGSSHWLGCDCHESAWAEKLAAAEAEASVNAEYGHTAALRMNRIRQVIGDTTRDGFEYSAAEIARTVLAECDMPMEPELRRLIASEERVEKLEEALRPFADVAPLLSDHESDAQLVVGWSGLRGTGRLNHGDFRRAVAALAPPPEAEKRGEG